MHKINRRRFLGALAGLGAALALPVEPDKATYAQIDKAWEALEATPYVFAVENYGTIAEPTDKPKVRRDVYDIDTADINTIDDLIYEVRLYDELRSHFQGLAPEEDENAGDEAWVNWLKNEPATALSILLDELETWLDSEVDWMQMEYWPTGWGGQGKAMAFFEQLGRDVLNAIGVVIVEGEHPGSTYFAAELYADIAQANAATAQLGLPFRFHRSAS